MLATERQHILRALQANHWNATTAAIQLQITFRAMRYAMAKHDFPTRHQQRAARLYRPKQSELKSLPVPAQQTTQWSALRMATLRKYGARCQCCGATARDGVRIHVDHILPQSKYPHLALDPDNLQVLCQNCNGAKSNTCTRDWR